MGHDPWGALTAVVAILTMPLGLLTGLTLGFLPAAVVFIVGWFVLTPLLPIFGHQILPMLRDARGSDESDQASEPSPEEELKRRYVRGEIDESEFERRMSELVEYDPPDADGAVDSGEFDLETDLE